jgi:hypothetical protein
VVIKYTKAGNPYRTPPYSAAERAEISKGLNDTPTVVGHYRKPPQGKPQRPQQQEEK